jgi:hypothetical protein
MSTPSPLTGARTRVADALAGITVPVHSQPPATPNPPCVVLLPGTPWIQPKGHVTIDVVCHANPAGGNAPALDRLEALVHEVREALYAAQLAAGDVTPPEMTTLAGALSCSMPVTLRVSCH